MATVNGALISLGLASRFGGSRHRRRIPLETMKDCFQIAKTAPGGSSGSVIDEALINALGNTSLLHTCMGRTHRLA